MSAFNALRCLILPHAWVAPEMFDPVEGSKFLSCLVVCQHCLKQEVRLAVEMRGETYQKRGWSQS